MTIVVGIICKDAIVLATDSQTTFGGMKRMDADKISSVSFFGSTILVAQAGNAGNCARAIELLSDMAKGHLLTDYRTPADMAASAMLKVKEQLWKSYGNCPIDEFERIFHHDDQQSELMLAYYFDSKPYIFTTDLWICRADKENSHYAAIGCGANLGSYLLSEHANPQMKARLASVIAVYTIETVCKHDAYCSTPTKLAWIKDTLFLTDAKKKEIFPSIQLAGVAIFNQKAINTMAKAAEQTMQSAKSSRNKKIEKLLVKKTEPTFEEFFKELSQITINQSPKKTAQPEKPKT